MQKANIKLTAAIVDDDFSSSALLNSIITDFIPELEVTQIFNDAQKAATHLTKQLPDILFVDVEMPVMDGISLVKLLDPGLECMVVFVTGHADYAIDAIKLGAREFLLKPITANSVKDAIQNLLKRRIEQEEVKPNRLGNKILIKKLDRISILDLDNVVYFEADRAYTVIYLMNDEPIRSSKPLGIYKKALLLNSNFIEINRSIIINLNHVKNLVKEKDKSLILLGNGGRLKISNRTSYALIQSIEKMIPHTF